MKNKNKQKTHYLKEKYVNIVKKNKKNMINRKH